MAVSCVLLLLVCGMWIWCFYNCWSVDVGTSLV